MSTSHNDDSTSTRTLVGWLCPSRPDGPIIPLHALIDPCGGDRPVYDDGTIGPPPNASYETPS